MFKSIFAKYITAFVMIIFVSFAVLFGIITSMIRIYTANDRDERLANTVAAFIDQIDDMGLDGRLVFADTERLAMIIGPIVNIDSDTDMIITDGDGNIILRSIESRNNNGKICKLTAIGKEGAAIDMTLFTEVTENDGREYLVYYGNVDGIVPSRSVMYALPERQDGAVIGYCIAYASTEKEDAMLVTTRRMVVSGSIWVMVAAAIATFFITERITHPLHRMTGAAKSFAKGDFTARVRADGGDEVAELGRAFNQMAESLSNLETMRNSFLASVSHDLRTPMTTIAGFIDGITSGAIPPDKHEYYLDVISAEVHRLSRLVSQLLDISRLESGDRKLTFNDFDIAELTRIVLISFENKIDEKKLDVEYDAERDSMLVHADKDAIHQVVYNLIHNAVKFAKEGGKLSIKLRYTEGKRITVSVYDEGQGIAPDEQTLVFERFYKTDKSRGLDKNGVGLGLYICKTIIDAHDESIGVRSEPDKYCEFYFTLKCADGGAKK